MIIWQDDYLTAVARATCALGSPFEYEILKIGLFKFPPPGAKIVFKYPTQFFVTGKLSDHDFPLLNQALKTRPCETFLLRHSLAKVNSLP